MVARIRTIRHATDTRVLYMNVYIPGAIHTDSIATDTVEPKLSTAKI
jgi:hypothetical protein